MKVRFVQPVSMTARLFAYWGEDCTNCCGSGDHTGQHRMRVRITVEGPVDFARLSLASTYDFVKPERCENCGAAAPPSVLFKPGFEYRWNTPDGKLFPGDMYFIRYHQPGGCPYWDDCDGLHLNVVLPNKAHWDIDSRANNCTLKGNRRHRCWVRNGQPPNITVNKSGRTCTAGAGSIVVGNYHGFLREGEFVPT